MTEREINEEIGRMNRDLADARRAAEASAERLTRKAKTLRDLGEALLRDPDGVLFPGEMTANPAEWSYVITEDVPTLLQLRGFVDDLKANRGEVGRLEDRLRKAGAL